MNVRFSLLLSVLIRSVVADSVVITSAKYVIKENHYSLSNHLFDNGSPMTYDPATVDDVGAAFSLNYTDPGGSGMDAYPSGIVGGTKSGGKWRPGDKSLTGMPVRISDLGYDFRIQWSVAQENANDDDDKWWATINVIFDSGTSTEFSEPVKEDRLFDIVIQLDRYEQDDLEDVSKNDKNTYWWFARNNDTTIRPFTFNINGQDYQWGVRYKFFQNQGWKDNKVHVKFIPIDNSNVAPFIDHPLRDFTEAASEYLQYCDLPQEERARANARVSEPTLWVKAISAGYETYSGNSTLIQTKLKTINDTTPPATPTGLIATITSASTVQLSWDAVSDDSFHGYTVERSNDDGGTFVALSENLHSNSFVDPAASNGTIYFYRVTAEDRSYNISPPSNVVCAQASSIDSSMTQTQSAMRIWVHYDMTPFIKASDGNLYYQGYANKWFKNGSDFSKGHIIIKTHRSVNSTQCGQPLVETKASYILFGTVKTEKVPGFAGPTTVFSFDSSAPPRLASSLTQGEWRTLYSK